MPSANFENLGTEVEPIYLAIQANKLEIFIEWMNLGTWQRHPFNEAQLIELFHVGSMFICLPATDWVLTEFESMNLIPARKLGLALKLGIRRWIEPAEEQEALGYQAVSILAIGQLRSQDERKRRSILPPPINHSFGVRECQFHGPKHDKSRCAQCWDTLWILEVGRKLCHPVKPISFSNAVGLAQGLSFEGVTPQCQEMGLDSLRNVVFGEIDQRILNNVVVKLVGLLPMSPYSEKSIGKPPF
ncbi:hypothetical protein BT96DRAFT_1005347 [Gymnopus androsaceus JB14]|uniref:Uncharacterized protein n=1 Tax=Gymnopus androsaceus JB14 TaxID=1447944 RepID=A0A6A4GN67_9AGAR|nr:hypothetical protein BT96DRAFT_1005347 [Gymnopus androsaceus JB14]